MDLMADPSHCLHHRFADSFGIYTLAGSLPRLSLATQRDLMLPYFACPEAVR
jgi:hypothetical protein